MLQCHSSVTVPTGFWQGLMQSTYILISAAEYAGVQIEIAGPKYHHLVRVRRMRPGMVLRAALPDGRLLEAEISEITPDILRARVLREEMITGLSPCRITLHQAVLKGEKMELVVQKASELGVATLAPLLTRRSIPQWSPQQAAQRVERWQRIADAAAEQCERCIPMLVEMPRPLPQALQVEEPNRFLLHERQGFPLPAIAEKYPRLSTVGLFVGPEGGWSEEEVALLIAAGAMPIHLGGRILRAETASLVAVTLAQYIWGDLDR